MYQLALDHFRKVDTLLHQAGTSLPEFEITPSPNPFEALFEVLMSDPSTFKNDHLMKSLSPKKVIETPIDVLTSYTSSEANAFTIKMVSIEIIAERLPFDTFTELPNGVLLNLLTSAGLTPLQAKNFLVKGLGRKDVFILEDSLVAEGIRKLYDFASDGLENIEGFFAKLKPYRSYGSLILRNSVESGSF